MSKIDRLTRADFTSERTVPKRFHGKFFSLSASPLLSKRKVSVACVVSKKVAPKAVQRNLIKRHCREAVRAATRKSALPTPFALIFRAKKDVVGATFRDVLRDVASLVDKIADTRYNTPQ